MPPPTCRTKACRVPQITLTFQHLEIFFYSHAAQQSLFRINSWAIVWKRVRNICQTRLLSSHIPQREIPLAHCSRWAIGPCNLYWWPRKSCGAQSGRHRLCSRCFFHSAGLGGKQSNVFVKGAKRAESSNGGVSFASRWTFAESIVAEPPIAQTFNQPQHKMHNAHTSGSSVIFANASAGGEGSPTNKPVSPSGEAGGRAGGRTFFTCSRPLQIQFPSIRSPSGLFYQLLVLHKWRHAHSPGGIACPCRCFSAERGHRRTKPVTRETAISSSDRDRSSFTAC